MIPHRLQFRVLYREFLFRMVDLELLSAYAEGDTNKLFGQFATVLVQIGILLALGALGLGGAHTPPEARRIAAWTEEHFLISTTMLVVGLFAVLSWDSTFPDRRDVLVLAPLPVRTRTMFFAKVAAVGAALSVTVASLNAFAGFTLPFAMVENSANLFDLLFSVAFIRGIFAYWVTMLAAGLFVFCCVLGVQGLAAQLLPRRQFLRVSGLLQMAAFCTFVSVYFLEPPLVSPRALSAPENQRLLASLPSYWFLGLFQQLNGSMHPAMAALPRRAWTGLGGTVLIAGGAFLLSYFHTLRKIVEEPDIAPAPRGLHWSPRFGNSLRTAIVVFSARSLSRSRQHRMMLAFYLGIGFAFVILIMKPVLAQQQISAGVSNVPLMASSVVAMCVAVIGMRVVFAMPLSLRANWVFRMTEVREARRYLSTIRLPLFMLAFAPVWAASAALFFAIWPWQLAAGHLAVLGLWGIMLAYLGLYRFQKIPFTCSYLPGKSHFHMAFLAGIALLVLILQGVQFERSALQDSTSFFKMIAILGAATLIAIWRTVAMAGPEEAVKFEEAMEPEVTGLGLYRDGALPLEPGA